MDYIIEKLSNEDPFVREARLSFQKEYGNKKFDFRSSIASVSPPNRNRKITINIQPAWSYAKNINTAKLQGLEIPILESIASRKMFNYDKTPISPEDNKLRAKNSFKRLLYYKTKQGKNYNIILSYLPDVNYVKKFSGRISKGSLSMRTIKAIKYSGYIEYSRLDGRGIFVLQFKEGKIVRRHIYKYKNSTKLSETDLVFKSASNNIQIKNSMYYTPIASSMGSGIEECEECTPVMIRVCAGELEEEEVEDEDCGDWTDSGNEECTPIECEDEGGNEDPYPPCYPDCDPCEEPDGYYICDPDNPDPDNPEDPNQYCIDMYGPGSINSSCGCIRGTTGITDCNEIQEVVIVRDKTPQSYHWRTLFNLNPDPASFLTKTTPQYITVNGIEVPNPDAFNCHYHTFGSIHPNDSGFDPNFPKWATIPDTRGYSEVPIGSPIQVGDRVIYFSIGSNGNYGVTHSGIVIEVDTEGYATKISSKMGEYEIIEHHPRDIPTSYGDTDPSINHNGAEKPTRRYFRK